MLVKISTAIPCSFNDRLFSESLPDALPGHVSEPVDPGALRAPFAQTVGVRPVGLVAQGGQKTWAELLKQLQKKVILYSHFYLTLCFRFIYFQSKI